MASTHNYGILPDHSQEDDLHATRLLLIEEKPFERVKSSLLGPKSLLTHPPSLPTPPPEDDAAPTASQDSPSNAHFRSEILLDFSALESSILRIQLILASNARERARYAAEKSRILSTAAAVRANTAALRLQLQEAQRLLLLRKGYDEMAAKLIDPRKLKPRAEVREEMEGLEKEIEELAQEGREVEGLWEGRKEAWTRVVREGEALRRVVRGIKEVEEKAEVDGDGMEDVEGEDGGMKMGEQSRIASPAPEGMGRTPIPDREATPTLREDGEEGDAAALTLPTSKFLELHGEHDATRLSSRAASPMTDTAQDVDMTMDPDGNDAPLEPQAKTTAGMEVSATAQVSTPAEGMEEEDDQQPMAAVGVDVGNEDFQAEAAVAVVPVEGVVEDDEVAMPAEEMDES